MYDEKIEALIKAALADGVLTEKEKQILFKNAQAQGIDLDEFEMVLDARLVELQKAEKEKAEKSAPKSDKYGDVRKCPTCGSLVPALATCCSDCGYEFTGVGANTSSQLLAKKIEEINKNQSQKVNEIKLNEGECRIDFEDRQWRIMNTERIELISRTIRSFPIPNTKADLFEFITTMQSNMLSTSVYKLEGEAYLAKYNEAITKAGALFKNDPIILPLIENQVSAIKNFKQVHRKQKKYDLKPSVKNDRDSLRIIVFLFGIGIILIILGLLFPVV